MVKNESERPVIDIQSTSEPCEEIFWDIEGFPFPSVSPSLLSIKLTLQRLLRRDFEISSLFQAILDKIIIKKLPEKYIDWYVKTTPYLIESIFLLPILAIYRLIDDDLFDELHYFVIHVRLFFLWKYPVRLLFSGLSAFYKLIIPSGHHIGLLLGRHGPKWVFLWFSRRKFANITRKMILCFGLCAEVFGERLPNDRILPHKAPVAKNSVCNKNFLNHLQSQRYNSQNLPLLDLSLNQDRDSIELEIIPEFSNGIGEKSFEQKVLRLKNRKKLRIRSKLHARKVRNGITRNLLL